MTLYIVKHFNKVQNLRNKLLQKYAVLYDSKMIKIKLRGGLGNQLFQLAAGLYICHRNKSDYLVDSEFIGNKIPALINFGFVEANKYSDKSNFLDKVYVTKPNNRHKAFLWEKKFEAIRIKAGETYTDPSDLDEYDLHIPRIKNIRTVRGWFQTQIYANELAKYGFNFRSTSWYNSLKVLNKYGLSKISPSQESFLLSQVSNENTIVIHVRCYEEKLSNSLGILSDNFYINAVKKMSDSIRTSRNIDATVLSIIIVCDNKTRSSSLAKKLYNSFGIVTYTLDDELYDKDEIAFYLITKAKNLVIANSTFSWWGAYLGEADSVIAPERWYYKSPYSKGLYLKDWATVAADWA